MNILFVMVYLFMIFMFPLHSFDYLLTIAIGIYSLSITFVGANFSFKSRNDLYCADISNFFFEYFILQCKCLNGASDNYFLIEVYLQVLAYFLGNCLLYQALCVLYYF